MSLIKNFIISLDSISGNVFRVNEIFCIIENSRRAKVIFSLDITNPIAKLGFSFLFQLKGFATVFFIFSSFKNYRFYFHIYGVIGGHNSPSNFRSKTYFRSSLKNNGQVLPFLCFSIYNLVSPN